MIGITILGSTGSVGLSTLDVVSRHQDKFELIALTANKNIDGLYEQCLKWQPKMAVMADEACAEELRKRLASKQMSIEVLAGREGLQYVSAHEATDYVMASIVGAAGLLPTLAAAQAGKRVLLANKEALVMSGKLFMDAVKDNDAELLPIDSEHNAIFQCMPPNFRDGLQNSGVKRILLTASGGPFRTKSVDELAAVTPDEACAHPNWDMGRKISVDSATMMNKGLELIEACWLFDTDTDNVEVVIHPQSIVHSLVEYTDGSVLAQLGNPDMRTPIAHAMAWPERIASGVSSLDLYAAAQLDFEAPDLQRFPSLKLAKQAMDAGGTATAILNAANEVAVENFLNKNLKFTDIPVIVEKTLSAVDNIDASSLENILAADNSAREYALSLVA